MLFLKHKCISLLSQFIASLTRNQSFRQSLQTYFLDLETVKNVALVEKWLPKDNLITPKKSRKQYSAIKYELYIKSLIFPFILLQITYLQFDTTRSYQLLRGLQFQPRDSKRLMLCIVGCRLNSIFLISEEHKTQGTGGSKAPLDL